ncbi:DUF2024 family protein [Sphingobacterium sp. BIGb0165]|uniref:DUF2024 family protein n=1 Tax=Sphingobacterium sp. BIGb0165 TaxID=2940615 RepID=UPI00216895BA|nr:DUF2024 family protein [Sphingobacterium sp. BIGb0165]MCS4225946.1 hypothetical protein [Sphingobacterium sp. BIGb0165]
MKVTVWDTYVKKQNGETMHFDIIAPEYIREEAIIHQMGKEYLATKQHADLQLTAKECRLCHQEIASAEMLESLHAKGYFIIEMEGCD